MKNYKYKFKIEKNDVYNALPSDVKNQCKELKITNAKLLSNGDIEIECLALTDEIIECPYLYKLFINANS